MFFFLFLSILELRDADPGLLDVKAGFRRRGGVFTFKICCHGVTKEPLDLVMSPELSGYADISLEQQVEPSCRKTLKGRRLGLRWRRVLQNHQVQPGFLSNQVDACSPTVPLSVVKVCPPGRTEILAGFQAL